MDDLHGVFWLGESLAKSSMREKVKSRCVSVGTRRARELVWTINWAMMPEKEEAQGM